MIRLLGILIGALRSTVRTHRELALENLALRQQRAMWKARQPRPRLTSMDRIFWDVLSRLWKSWRNSLRMVRPETVASAGVQALLGVEESTPTRSARDHDGAPRSDSAEQPRQSSRGAPRQSARTGPGCSSTGSRRTNRSAPKSGTLGARDSRRQLRHPPVTALTRWVRLTHTDSRGCEVQASGRPLARSSGMRREEAHVDHA
jgi:hypothetical protein